MIDAQALEVLSTNESKGFPHQEMMKAEALMYSARAAGHQLHWSFSLSSIGWHGYCSEAWLRR